MLSSFYKKIFSKIKLISSSHFLKIKSWDSLKLIPFPLKKKPHESFSYFSFDILNLMSLQIFWFWKTSNILVFSSSPKKNGFPSHFLKKLNSFLKKKKKKRFACYFKYFSFKRDSFLKKWSCFLEFSLLKKIKPFLFKITNFSSLKKKSHFLELSKKKKI